MPPLPSVSATVVGRSAISPPRPFAWASSCRPSFRSGRAANQFYVRPFIEITGFSGGGASDSQALFGIGGGLKIPLRDRIASRFEANFAHTNGSDMIGLLAGLSFYTR